VVVETRTPYEYKITFEPRPTTRPFWFSPTEIRHLTISALLVTAVGLTWFYYEFSGVAIIVSSALIFMTAFLLHEIAHKLTAQHHGLWAEFRLTMIGALLTLISIISPFKIISPGAVMIAGYANKEVIGKTAIAGPLVNISMSIVSFAIYRYSPHLFVARMSAIFNAWIALINLIPFGVLDGWKVFSWDKIVWLTTFITALALTILTFLNLPF
jgi:Zn-dependent protease